MTKPFFLADTMTAPYALSAETEEGKAFLNYLGEVVNGPADGEQDIEWQSSGRGYYAHLEALGAEGSQAEQQAYTEKLRADINIWLTLSPGNPQVEAVRRQLG